MAPATSNLGGIEGTSLLITGHKLNRYNYLQWSSSVIMFICGKGKMTTSQVKSSYQRKMIPSFEMKDGESHVMSWLINSMINKVGENFLLHGTTKEI